MTQFIIVQEIFSGNRDKFIKNFEEKVEAHLNKGWKAINCSIENGAAYAFMQKE